MLYSRYLGCHSSTQRFKFQECSGIIDNTIIKSSNDHCTITWRRNGWRINITNTWISKLDSVDTFLGPNCLGYSTCATPCNRNLGIPAKFEPGLTPPMFESVRVSSSNRHHFHRNEPPSSVSKASKNPHSLNKVWIVIIPPIFHP